jgi:hypothetical protein
MSFYFNFLHKQLYDFTENFLVDLSTAVVWLTDALYEKALSAAGIICSLKYPKIFNNFLPKYGR